MLATQVTKNTLSPRRRQLLAMMQELNFGTVEEFPVADGEPILDPQPRIFQQVKLSGESGAREEATLEDFALKVPVQKLFALFDLKRNCRVCILCVQNGIPTHIRIQVTS